MFDIFAGKDANKALQRAHELVKEGKIASAIRVLEENLTEGEESFDLYLDLAKLHFEEENRTRAVELLRKIHALAPGRSDELVGTVSDLFYRRTSIDIGDFLLQLHVNRREYEDINKVLRAFSDREIKLLLTRYEKLKQLTADKKLMTTKSVENILILAAIKFFLRDSKGAVTEVEAVTGVDAFNKTLIPWARVVAREYYNDNHASLLLIKVLAGAGEYDELISLAQRGLEKFPDSVSSLIEIFGKVHPPKNLAASIQQFLTELYVRKGDLDASIERLQGLLKSEPAKADDVVKALRDLERANVKNLKVLYALSDTYLLSHRISLAMTELDKILEIDPGQHAEVLNRYKKAFSEEPNNPQVITGLVNFYLQEGNLTDAVNTIEHAYAKDRGLIDEYILNLNQILEKDINNKKALYLLGLCYAHKGEKDGAVIVFETLMDNKNNEEVDAALSDILKDSPDDFDYLNIQAKNLAVLKREEEAFALVKPFIKDEKKLLSVLPALDMIFNKKPALSDDIVGLFEKHKKEEPFIFELALGRIYAFREEFNKSVKSFEFCLASEDKKDTAKRALVEVIKERPKAVPLLLAAARMFMKDGEVEIATEFFKTAQAIDPKAFFEIIDEFYDTLKTYPQDREVRVLLIDTFFQRKLWERVIDEAKKGTEVFGQQAQYFNLKLGQALVESGGLTDAVRPLMLSLDGDEDCSAEVIKYLDRIIEIDKSNVPAHFARGRALAKAKHIEEAVEEYLHTARIVPARAEYVLEELRALASRAIANPKIIFAIGNLEVMLKKYDDGIKHLLQACELDNVFVKSVIPLFEKIRTTTKTSLLEFSLARVYHIANMKDSAVKLYINAQNQTREYREPAITELKKICAEDLKDLESRKGLAEIYFAYNNYEDTLAILEEIYLISTSEDSWVKTFILEILKKNPNHLPAYYLLLNIFIQESNYPKAVDVAKKLTEISPSEAVRVAELISAHGEKSPEIAFHLGSIYRGIGDLTGAVRMFDQLFKRDPGYGDRIESQLKEIMIKNSTLPEAYLLSSKIAAYRHEYGKAIEHLHNVARLIPEKHEEVALREAQLYFDMGDVKKAIEIYNKVLEKTKDRKIIYKLIKRIQNDYINEKIEVTKGTHDEDRLNRANLFLQIGRVHEAEKELQFAPGSGKNSRLRTLLYSKIYLKKNRPIDAFETIKSLPIDAETALVYAQIYEAMGSYETAASVLRQVDAIGMAERIKKLEKLAQSRRRSTGRYYIEGRI